MQDLGNLNANEQLLDVPDGPGMVPPPKLDMDKGVGLKAVEAGEVDISVTDKVQNVDTAYLTQSNIIPIQSRDSNPIVALDGVWKYRTVANIVHNGWDTPRSFPRTLIKGTSLVKPYGIVPFATSEFTIESDNPLVSSLDYGSVVNRLSQNGPSMAISPGTPREAEFEVFLTETLNVIVSYFNRSIPFTDMPLALRYATLMFEAEDLALAIMPILAISSIRGQLSYQTKLGEQVDDTIITNLYNQDVFTIINQGIRMIANMYVYDAEFFERFIRMFGLFVPCKRAAIAAAYIAEDLAFDAYGLATGRAQLTSPDKKYTVSNTTRPPLMPQTMVGWMKVFANAQQTDARVQLTLQAWLTFVSNIAKTYEKSQGFWMQLHSRGALKLRRLKDFIPQFEEVPGFIIPLPTAKEPQYSKAFHERFEYAPEVLEVEDVGGVTLTIARWNQPGQSDESFFFPYPGRVSRQYAGSTNTSAFSIVRPVGKRHGSKTWTTKEILDIGLWGRATDAPNVKTFTFSNGVQLSTVGNGFADLYWGWGYTPGVSLDGAVVVNGTYRTAPIYCSVTNLNGSNLTQIETFSQDNAHKYWGMAVNPSIAANSPVSQAVAYYTYLANIASTFDLSWLYMPIKNTAGEKQVPLLYSHPYANTQWERVPLSVFNAVVGQAFGTLLDHPALRRENSPLPPSGVK